jgi:hypothetical protein
MQNTDARVAADGLLGVMTPAGDPFSVMLWQVVWPKQPAR